MSATRPASRDDRPPSTPRPSLTANAAILTLGSLFTQAALVLNLSLLARLVAKDQIATYQQLNLLYGIVSPLLLGGVPAALLYFIPRSDDVDERRAWISRAYVSLGCMGLVSAVAVWALRHELAAAFNNPELARAVALYAPYLLFAFIFAATPPGLVASGHPRAAAALNAALGGLTLIAAVTAALIEPTGTALAIALTVSGGIMALASVIAVRRSIGFKFRDSRRSHGIRQMLGYGLPLALTGLAGTIGFQFDRVVVGSTFSPSTFAIYALGAVEIPIGLLLAQAVTNVLVPELSLRWREGDRAGMLTLWHEAMRKTSLLLFPLFVFLMFMAEDTVRVLYGGGYSESVRVFRIYLLLIPGRIATWGLIPQAIRRTGINLTASFVILASNAVVALALVHPLGITGPAVAGPASVVIAIVYYLARLRPILGVGLRVLLPVGPLAATFAVAAIAGLPLIPLIVFASPSIGRLAAAGVIYGGVAVVLLRVTRRLSDDDWARVSGVLGGLLSRFGRRRAART